MTTQTLRTPRWVWAALLLPLAIYLVFPLRDHSLDAVGFTWGMEQPTLKNVLHRAHLLYHTMGYLLYHAGQAVGWSWSAMQWYQVINTLMAGWGIVLVYAISRRLVPSAHPRAALLAAYGCAFSLAWWLYALEAETYAVPTALTLWTVWWLQRWSADVQPLSWRRACGIGGLVALTILWYISTGLNLGLVAWWAWRQPQPVWRRVRWIALTTAVSLGLTAVVYWGVMSWADPAVLASRSAFIQWMFGEKLTGMYGGWQADTLGLTVIGLARSVLAAEVWKHLAVHWRTPTGLTWLAAASAVVVGGGLTAIMGWAAYRWRLLHARYGLWSELLALWLALYGGFAMWWTPYTPEFWVHLMAPLWITVCAVTMLWSSARWRWVVAVVVAVLAVANFAAAIGPGSRLERSQRYQLCQALQAAGVGSDDMVLVPDYLTPICRHYLGITVYSNSLSFSRGEEVCARMRQQIAAVQAGGHRVLLSDLEWHPPVYRPTMLRFTPREAYTACYASYAGQLQPRFSYRWDGVVVPMYEVMPPGDRR